MTDNYSKIVRDNLDRLYGNLPPDLAKNLPAEQDGDRFVFDAFGEKCRIEPDGIVLGEEEHASVLGILISLCYIFYEADDEFPASVTCLYSNNARLFLPVDALADVGEYSSRKILKLIE